MKTQIMLAHFGGFGHGGGAGLVVVVAVILVVLVMCLHGSGRDGK